MDVVIACETRRTRLISDLPPASPCNSRVTIEYRGGQSLVWFLRYGTDHREPCKEHWEFLLAECSSMLQLRLSGPMRQDCGVMRGDCYETSYLLRYVGRS